ncbi:MAG: hypothetical protein P8X90_35670 [Desulfobacterales bacterium]
MPGKPKPQFSYFVSHGNVSVTSRSPIWQQPLPVNRSLSPAAGDRPPSYGDYFTAVRTFLENTGGEFVSHAIQERSEPETKPVKIRRIRVNLEKHGEFYHPAHLQVLTGHQEISFVLNVAVSETGIRHIMDEYRCLQKLNSEFDHSFLPRVYGIGEVTAAGNRRIRMFLGQWFEDYHEFHLTRSSSDNKSRIAVWLPRNNRFFLSLEQSRELYRQAARILAYYYDVETFLHISAWHHAAGDFIVRVNAAGLDVKLITVRRYTPLLTNVESLENTESPELILQALLIFFLKLSIRTRLDRLDGVGDMVWAEPASVGPTLAGFAEGLALKPPVRALPDTIERCFRYYLSVCSRQDLYDLIDAVAKSYHPDTAEHRLLRRNIDEHVETLSGAISTLCR